VTPSDGSDGPEARIEVDDPDRAEAKESGVGYIAATGLLVVAVLALYVQHLRNTLVADDPRLLDESSSEGSSSGIAAE
jgi:hypothetical protein